MRAIIVDDEELPRTELRRMLASFPELEIVGEASDSFAARDLIAEAEPDLVFLDIQMPEESGFELLGSLPVLPRIIFVTAFDHYALKAFEFGAFDYLLKPVEPSRLAAAVRRVLVGGAQAPTAPAGTTVAPTTRLDPDQKVLFRTAERFIYVKVAAIEGAEAHGAYAKIWVGPSEFLIHRSLGALERRLPEKHFFRANRAAIVNVDAIARVEPWFSGGLQLQLTSGRTVEVSRRQAKELRDRLSI